MLCSYENTFCAQKKKKTHIQQFVTLSENPAKVIILWFAVFYKKKIILHMVKNIFVKI